MKDTLPLYPFFFALWTALNAALYRHTTSASTPWRLVAAVSAVAAVAMVIVYRLAPDRQRGAFWMLVTMVPLLLWGMIFTVVRELVGATPPWLSFVLAALVGVVYIAAGVRFLRKPRKSLTPVTQLLNVTACALVVAAAYLYVSARAGYQKPQIDVPAGRADWSPTYGRAPDIYYIILDGYARSDVLREVYDYDNTPFLNELEDQGFYIASESSANYIYTAFSISSSLNMCYLDEVAPLLGPTARDWGPATYMVHNSAVRQFLEDKGYAFVPYSTGVVWTDVPTAEHYWRVPTAGLTLPETRYVDLSIVGLLQHVSAPVEEVMRGWGFGEHRSRVLGALEALPNVTREFAGRPVFVFAHIIAPHPPFVLDAEGRYLTPSYPFSLADITDNPLSPEEFAEGYLGQVAYLSRSIPDVLAQIVANSEVPPIIVLQADHGPGRGDRAQSFDAFLAERAPILNAYLLPDGPGRLYPAITPVNSFRVILDEYFGTSMGLIHDRVYASPDSHL